jgi:small-conductance mechanosensitive channel
MARRYPMPRTEVEPRVFVSANSNYIQLATRFVIPVRQARTIKDRMTRRILERFSDAGIAVASATMDITVRNRA